MNPLIDTLNHWGGNFLSFAWPMFWQSSLLIAALFAFDFLCRRKLRASLRYTLWLVVLVKLCLPPTLASPTSPAWWLWRKTPPPVVMQPVAHYTVTYDNTPLPEMPQTPLPVFVPPKPAMTLTAWLLVISASISGALLLWLLVRWWQVIRQVRRAASSERLARLTDAAQKLVGMKFKVRVKLTTNSMSPAVCGLFWPAILIPQSLAENFSDGQLRAVLLHELIHLRRRDVWLNFTQALLQIFYWWHPLLWLANARIRRVREEAVDDAVMLALRDDAEAYAPTLLEVAKLALNRPLASLGLVGIMESRHALRQRIERLVDFRPPHRAGLTLVSLLGILAFTAVAVPMGEGPEKTTNPALPVSAGLNQTNSSSPMTGNPSRNTNSFEAKTKAGQLIQDGKLLYEMGKLDEAETKFKAVLALDPENAVAKFYLGLAQREYMESKLKRIHLDASFERLSLAEVVRQLNEMAKQKDPEKIGVQFSTTTNSVFSQLAGINSVVINLPYPLPDVRLCDALSAIVLSANQPIKYSVLEDGVVFSAKTPADFAEDAKLLMRTFRSDKIVFTTALQKATGSQSTNVWLMATEYFNSLGVDLTKPGKGIYFNERLGQLDVRATEQDLNTIERAVEMFNSAAPQNHATATPTFDDKLSASQLAHDAILLFEMGKSDEAEVKFKAALALDPENAAAKYYLKLLRPRPSNLLPAPNTRAQTNLIYTGAGRQIIETKLDRIRMDALFDNLPLSEVILRLSDQAKLRDPDKKGINFMINNNNGTQATTAAAPNPLGATGTVDPATGLPPAAGGGQAMDIRQAVINLNPALTNARLVDVLDAIVHVSSQPIKYSVLDYAIEFSAKGPDVPQLFTRTFKVNPDTFAAALRNIPGVHGDGVPVMARNYFKTFGVDLESPGKSIFYGDRLGMLSVRATDQDLDTIERAIQALNQIPPQVHLKVRFVEVTRDKGDALSFDWLGQLSSTSNSMISIVSNSPSLNVPGSTANLPGVFPGNMAASGGSSNSAPANATVAAVLTDTDSRVAFHYLELHPGFEHLAETEATTASGRRTVIRATDIKTIVKGYIFKETATNSALDAQAEQIETGPILDTIIYVLADGYTINLTTTASYTNFLGYDQPTNTAFAYDKTGRKINVPVVLPRIEGRQAVANFNVWDGQTIVLGGLTIPQTLTTKNVVPFLGSLPVVGGLFRSESKREVTRSLIIFVTPTIVDPAGNRVHADDELPFAKTRVPVQPPQAKPK